MRFIGTGLKRVMTRPPLLSVSEQQLQPSENEFFPSPQAVNEANNGVPVDINQDTSSSPAVDDFILEYTRDDSAVDRAFGRRALRVNGNPRLSATEEELHRIGLRHRTSRPLELLWTQSKIRSNFLKLEKEVHPRFLKETIRYNANEPVRALFGYAGTALKMTFHQPDFYFIIILHVLLQVIYQTVLPDDARKVGGSWPRIDTSTLTFLGTLISFSLTFFTNSSYARYWDQFKASRRIVDKVRDFCSMLRTVFYNEAFEGADKLRNEAFNKVIAMVYLGYIFLPNFRARGMDKWGLAYLQQIQLLTTEEEQKLIDRMPAHPYIEVMTWICQNLWITVTMGKVPQRQYLAFEQNVQDIKAQFSTLYDYANMQIPFAYFHILNMSVEIYLLVIAYAYVPLGSSYMSIVPVVLTTLLLLGLRNLDCSLSDPLGDDETDIPVIQYIKALHLELGDLVNEPPIFGKVPCWVDDAHKEIKQT